MTIRALFWAVPLVFSTWIGLLIAVSVLSDAAPAYVVLWPTESFVESLPKGIAILGVNGWSITLSSHQDQFARALYDLGGRVVLPAGLPGCVPLPR